VARPLDGPPTSFAWSASADVIPGKVRRCKELSKIRQRLTTNWGFSCGKERYRKARC